MTVPDYVPDDLDPGEITACDNCGMVTTWPTGYATAQRCGNCQAGWSGFAGEDEGTAS